MNYSHRPRKRFGQNFLRDHMVLENIIHAVHPQKMEHLVEIGPGEGVLTQRLLPLTQKLDIIEIDRDLVAALTARYGNVTHLKIHSADALKFDFHTLYSGELLRIIGNLPYNISTPLLFHLFAQIEWIQDMHFLLQKEVVERLCAPVNGEHYGRLSVMAQYFCDCESLFHVPPTAFFPQPKVDSCVIRMIPLRNSTIIAKNIDTLSYVVQQAFAYRRKTIHNSLKSLVTTALLNQLHINPGARAQELSVDDFVRISNALLVK